MSSQRLRASLFVVLLLLVNIVMDGLPQFSSPFRVQIALLPLSFLLLFASFFFLRVPAFGNPERGEVSPVPSLPGDQKILFWMIVLFEVAFACIFFYETTHYARLGYRLLKVPYALTFGLIGLALGCLALLFPRASSLLKLVVFLGSYAAAHVLAIASFPLNYLRSDMLPVIFWADRALLAGQNPYQHFYVADRIYDFPYLPGMLLAFLPAQALHLDPRWAAIGYIVAGMSLVYASTARQFRPIAVLLIGLFVLCPYLQYRHELYTQGHFFSLILIFALMQRRHFGWSAAAFGLSMVISQFSWVIFPFFLLNALRRGGWTEVGRIAAISLLTAAVLMAPFAASGAGNIAHNAVGQWDRLTRPIARPINLAFWASYVIRPVHLKWVQLGLLSGMFFFCWAKRRCVDLADTLRWMIAALLVFILFNVLIDGYFYLMLLVPMLVYTCVANGWWVEPACVSLLRDEKQGYPPPSPILVGSPMD